MAYPPLMPFLAHVELALFGPSLVGLRLLSAVAQCVAIVFTGLMARELGGGRWAQVVAALAAGCAPISLIQGALFQYVSFDYLWWVLIACCGLRLHKSENRRWWLAIGIVAGLGLLTRYTIGILGQPGSGGAAHVEMALVGQSMAVDWGSARAADMAAKPGVAGPTRVRLAGVSECDPRAGCVDWPRSGYLPEQLFVSTNPLTVPTR